MKILLVDDHEMVRLGLKSYFDLQDDVEVVGEAANGSQGIDLALELRPDVIVMDIVMPEMNGIDATLAILKEWPEAKILIVTSYLDNEKIMPVLNAGARGYMLKTSSADELLHAVRKVAAGELAIEQEVSKKVEYHRNHMELHEDLTARERDVLQLIAKGYENQRIADELFISLKTVKTHVSNILAKLEVSDRTQAAVYAFQHHLVGHEEFQMSLADLLEELEAAKDSKKQDPWKPICAINFLFQVLRCLKEINSIKIFSRSEKTKIIDWDFADTCWEKESREYQYVAANYLKAMQSYLKDSDLPKLEQLVVTKSWWDTVDILDRVVGSLVYEKQELEKITLQWSLSDNIWLRRVAIDHQLLRKEKTNTQLMEKILLHNLNQTEFFTNKAIGWTLRDYSKTNPTWVTCFIEKNKERMAELSIKEASKYLYRD